MACNSRAACRTKRFWIVALLAFTFLCLTPAALAQRLDGTLRGTVTDQTGAVVAEAKVTLTNDSTQVVQTTTSTAAGTWAFPNLLVGSYTVQIEATGFETVVRKNLQVRSNQVTDTHIQLNVGSSDTTIEVLAGAEAVKTTTSDLGDAIPAQALRDLPIPSLGGSPLELATTLPNVIPNPGGVVGAGGAVGGNRPRNNNFSIDGADNNDVSVTGPKASVIPEAVAEFTVLTNQFSAEHGHSTGAQYDLITQSGTNNWHGAAWYFSRNRNLNATDNLVGAQLDAGTLTDQPRFDYNRVGGKLGGPILKDRAFIFGAYEYQTRGEQATGVTVLAPTATGLGALQSMAANPAVSNILGQFPIAPTATRTETVNGVPVEIGELQSFAPDFDNQHSFQINGDLNLGSHQLRTRYLYNRFRAPNVNGSLPLEQFNGSQVFNTHTAIVSDVWAINSRLVNEARLSYSRAQSGFTVPAQFADFPQVIVDTLGINLGPEGNSPQGGIENVYQVQDTVSYVAGPHNLKFGGEYRRWIALSDFLPRARGEFDYLNLQQLVNDEVPSGLNGALRGAGSGIFDGNQQAVYWFVQDDWKIHPRVTINLGLRYEWNSVPNGAQLQGINNIASVPGVLEFNVPRSDKNNFMPRVGFAWDVFGDGKTSVRGGFGMAYDVLFQNLPLLSLPPQLQSEQNPALTCTLDPSRNFCNTGQNFLASGGLLNTNVPPSTAAEARSATQAFIPDVVLPKVLTWSLGVQRELFKNTSVEVRYVGTRATQLPIQARLNALTAFEAGLQPLPVFFSASEIPTTVPTSGISTQQDFLDHLNCVTSCFLRFINEGFDGGFVTSFLPVGRSSYHAGSVDFVHRFGGFTRYTEGLYLRAAYTWSRAIDNATNELFTSRVNPRRPEDPFNLEREFGRSVLDVQHRFVLSWAYELPKFDTGSRVLNSVINGWQWNTIFQAQTGQPITALAGTDANGDFDSAGDRAILNPNGTSLTGTGVNAVVRDAGTGATSVCTAGCDPAQVIGYVAIDPSAQFVSTPLGALSTVGRNTIGTNGLNLWDMSFFKSIPVRDTLRVQFRAEFFNIFNHRNRTLGLPSVFSSTVNALSSTFSNVRSPQFLDDTQFSGGARQVQLGLKVSF